MGKIEDSIRGMIRAYHGSPYDFDRFDASKIGTGEGAQAYGHGLYFAENKAVADEYKRSVPQWPQYESPEQMAADYLFVHGSPGDAMRVMKEHGMWKGPRHRRELYRGAIQLLADGTPVAPKEFPFSETPPRMYEVEIGHPKEALLNWDAPLRDQPEALLKQLGPGRYFGMVGEPGDGERLWHNMRYGMGPQDAAKELVRHGVPGIRYLDRGSRYRGSGTSNYVIFPGAEDSIRILRKYGLLAPMAVGAASQGQE